jgi:PHD/YefM family antitoxin component YafN of YafNO toxin-antitoxin module
MALRLIFAMLQIESVEQEGVTGVPGAFGGPEMKTIDLDLLDADLREQMLATVSEPVLVTQHEQPVLVIRSLVDDEAADELIAQNPAFLNAIQRSREDRIQGRVRQLAELRGKYEAGEGTSTDDELLAKGD